MFPVEQKKKTSFSGVLGKRDIDEKKIKNVFDIFLSFYKVFQKMLRLRTVFVIHLGKCTHKSLPALIAKESLNLIQIQWDICHVRNRRFLTDVCRCMAVAL